MRGQNNSMAIERAREGSNRWKETPIQVEMNDISFPMSKSREQRERAAKTPDFYPFNPLSPQKSIPFEVPISGDDFDMMTPSQEFKAQILHVLLYTPDNRGEIPAHQENLH